MKLTLKKKISKTDWVNLDEGQKLKLDYPTLEQAQELEEILLKEEVAENKRMMEYQRLFIRFTIKDFDGLGIQCKLVDNQLEKEIWENLVLAFTQTTQLYELINKELEWTTNDRKK